jgi:hypothetical protein
LTLAGLVFIATACQQGPATADSSKPVSEGKGLFALGPKTTPVSVPAGTDLVVVIDESLSSASNRAGDRFDASLAAPLVIEGKTVILKGARVTGEVTAAKASGRLKDPGYLRLAIHSIEINGKEVALETSPVLLKGQSHKKRNIAMIGGGAGAGALIGGIAGGGKGALIGSAVGAGAGTTGAYATGKKDVTVPAEQRMSFRLTKAVRVQVQG